MFSISNPENPNHLKRGQRRQNLARCGNLRKEPWNNHWPTTQVLWPHREQCQECQQGDGMHSKDIQPSPWCSEISLMLYKAMWDHTLNRHPVSGPLTWKTRPHCASSTTGQTLGTRNERSTIQQHTESIRSSNRNLQKTDNWHHPKFQTFKIIKGIISVTQNCKCLLCPSKETFSKDTGTITRGHSKQFQGTTGLRHKFFSTRVINAWNSLSKDMIQTKTVNQLKSRLRREWKDHPDLHSYHFTN